MKAKPSSLCLLWLASVDRCQAGAYFWKQHSSTPEKLKDADEKPRPSSVERGKPLSRLSSKEMLQIYRNLRQEYQDRAFHRANDWKVLKRHDDCEVAILEHPQDPTCPYVRMTCCIPRPVADCWNFLLVENWDRTMPTMDPFYEGVDVVGTYTHSGVSMTLCRKRTKRILTFGKRDLVFLSVSDKPLSDGTWVSGSVSVVTPRVPRKAGYVRAFQDSVAFYKPTQMDSPSGDRTSEGCELTIVCRIDLNDSGADGAGGYVPMWIYVQTIGQTGVRSVQSMRDALIQEQREH